MTRPGRNLAFVASVSVALAMLTSFEPAAAQSIWELTPYEIELQVTFADDTQWTPRRRQAIVAGLQERLDARIGAHWNVEIAEPSPQLRAHVLAGLADRPPADDALPQLPDTDKLILLRVGAEAVEARELDLRTRIWGTPVRIPLTQRVRLDEDLFRAIVAAFAPLASIESVQDKQVTVRLQGSALAPRDETLTWLREGDLLLPITRYIERDGSLRRATPLDWTYLQVASLGDPDVEAQLHTGLRHPLSARRRGRVEQVALKVHPPQAPTQLAVRSRTEPDRPLAGYDVYAYAPSDPTTVHLGRSDRQGLVTIEPGQHPLRLILVKSGSELLARLPVVPGHSATLTALVPDDNERLAAEGFIVGLQEELVDLVIRREVLLALLRAYLDDGKLDAAKKLGEELASLRTRQQFANMLDREQQKTVSSDPVVQRKIDKLFTDTKHLLNTFMRAGPVEQAQAELREALARATGAPRPLDAAPPGVKVSEKSADPPAEGPISDANAGGE